MKKIATDPTASRKTQIYAKKLFNTFLNPFVYNPNEYFSASSFTRPEPLWGKHVPLEQHGAQVREKVSPGKERILTPTMKKWNTIGKVLTTSLGIAGTAGALHLLLRKAKNEKDRKKLQRYLNARYPIVSLDPSLQDLPEEERERALGIRGVKGLEEEQEPGEKTAQDDYKAPTGHESISAWWQNLVRTAPLTSGPMQPIMQAAVPPAAAFALYKLMDKVLDKRETEQLGAKNRLKQNILEQAMFEEYEKIRGRGRKEEGEKEAQQDVFEDPWESSREEGSVEGSSFLQNLGNMMAHPIQYASTTVPLALGAWSLGSATLAYVLAKRHFDKTDPKRIKMKKLQKYMNRRAVSRRPPMFTVAGSRFTPAPRIAAGAEPKKKTSVTVPEGGEPRARVEVEKKEEEPAAQVDASDPYAELLRT